ncbi:arylsulfatase, partial [Planctomycetota bacterium]
MRTIKYRGRACLLVAILAFWGCQSPQTNEPQTDKPNVIFILVDDLGYGDLGCYGQTRIQTPRLDRMAQEGMRFTQHYAGNTVCAPSRGALVSGLHTGHCTVRGNEKVLMRPDEPTLGTIMKEAGYETACIGKWGVGHWPTYQDVKQAGFDYFFGYLSMWHAHNSYPEFLWRNNRKVSLRNVVTHPPAHYEAGQENLTGVANKRHEHSNDLFTEDALAYIEGRKNNPFFLFLNYTIPHANNEATRSFRNWLVRENKGPTDSGVYDISVKPGPVPMEVPALGIYRDKTWPASEKAKAAMITHLDDSVGRLLDKLKKLGLDDKTLVIFTSDNGPHAEGVDPTFFNSSGPLRGAKRDLYEGGIRVPMIAYWPGTIDSGTESQHVSAFWDYLPTLAELADVECPPTDGISLVPGLQGQLQPKHEYLYWEFHESSSKQAVRVGKWKAVRIKPSDKIELYDMEND